MTAWQSHTYLPPVQVDGAMHAPDGAWRVEIVHRGRHPCYLTEAGVDLTTLADVGPDR